VLSKANLIPAGSAKPELYFHSRENGSQIITFDRMTARIRQDPNSRPTDPQEQLLPHKHPIFRQVHTRHKQIQASTHATSGRKSSREEHIPCPMSQLKLTDERTLQEPVPAVAQNQQGMLQLRPENQIAAPLPLSKRKHTKNHKGRTSIGASRSTSRKIRSRE
jgi:hypothetical protein